MREGRRSSSTPGAPRRKKSSYPVGIPVAPPPVYVPSVQPPPAQPFSFPPPGLDPASFSIPPPLPAFAPPTSRQVAPAGFQRDFSIALKVMLVVGLIVLGMAGGWFFFNGERDARPARQVAAGPTAPTEAKVAPRKVEPKSPPEKVAAPDVPPPVEAAPANDAVTFARDVLPIFRAKCISCHGANKKRGGLDARTVASLREGGDMGPAFRPGSVTNSPLWESIATDRMPPGRPKLTTSEKQVIRRWIATGAAP